MEGPLTLARLEVFRAVVEARSLTGAARRLHVSQPAISAQLRELERGLGLPLVERAGRHFALTEAGRTLAEHGARILDLEEETRRAVARIRGVETGRLAVGASETPGHYMLLEHLGEFQRLYPDIALRVDIAASAEIARRVVDGTLELGLIEAVIDDPALLRSRYVDDDLVLILAPDDPLASARRLDAEQIAAAPMVMREPGAGLRATIVSAMARAGVVPRIALELGSTEAVKRAVAAGLGLALVPQVSVAVEIADRRLATVPILGLETRRRLWQIRAARHRPSPAAEAFLALLLREAGNDRL